MVDCSQSPIFQCDRRDRVRLTVNGEQSTERVGWWLLEVFFPGAPRL